MENQMLPDKTWMGKNLLETLNNLKKRKRFRDPVAHIINNMETMIHNYDCDIDILVDYFILDNISSFS